MRKNSISIAVSFAIEQQRMEAATTSALQIAQEIKKASAGSVVSWARRPGKTRMHNLWMKLRGMV